MRGNPRNQIGRTIMKSGLGIKSGKRVASDEHYRYNAKLGSFFSEGEYAKIYQFDRVDHCCMFGANRACGGFTVSDRCGGVYI